MLPRTLTQTIIKAVRPGFIAVVYGPRRVGKTVLLNQLVEQFASQEKLVLNGDTQETRDLLNTTSLTKLSGIVKNHPLIAIDEAQRIPNIGLVLKVMIDNFPEKKIIVTGSASLQLARGMPEELTGRTTKFRLFPLSTKEISAGKLDFEKPYLLADQLTFGGYPYLTQLSTPQEKKQYLDSITTDYLLRDILQLKEVTAPEKLRKLAELLAFQIGSEVSLNELATNLGLDVKTVDRYLYLLKQGFIIFELGAFSRNLRKEIAKSKKYYFWDLGIRNSLTAQFSSLDVRSDLGALWENFLVLERLKKHEYERSLTRTYFWRTYDGAEIDFLEVQDEDLRAFKFKWQPQKVHTPKAFLDAYQTQVQLISKNNYLNFVGAG